MSIYHPQCCLVSLNIVIIIILVIIVGVVVSSCCCFHRKYQCRQHHFWPSSINLIVIIIIILIIIILIVIISVIIYNMIKCEPLPWMALKLRVSLSRFIRKRPGPTIFLNILYICSIIFIFIFTQFQSTYVSGSSWFSIPPVTSFESWPYYLPASSLLPP